MRLLSSCLLQPSLIKGIERGLFLLRAAQHGQALGWPQQHAMVSPRSLCLVLPQSLCSVVAEQYEEHVLLRLCPNAHPVYLFQTCNGGLIFMLGAKALMTYAFDVCLICLHN